MQSVFKTKQSGYNLVKMLNYLIDHIITSFTQNKINPNQKM